MQLPAESRRELSYPRLALCQTDAFGMQQPVGLRNTFADLLDLCFVVSLCFRQLRLDVGKRARYSLNLCVRALKLCIVCGECRVALLQLLLRAMERDGYSPLSVFRLTFDLAP